MSEWKKVSDEMPPEWDYVLCWRAEPTYGGRYHALGRCFRHSSGDVRWEIDGSSGHGVQPPVAWMALPDGPTERRS